MPSTSIFKVEISKTEKDIVSKINENKIIKTKIRKKFETALFEFSKKQILKTIHLEKKDRTLSMYRYEKLDLNCVEIPILSRRYPCASDYMLTKQVIKNKFSFF